MDTPTPSNDAPRRVLKPSGTAPVAKRRLVSASGKTIESKPSTKLMTAAGKPADVKQTGVKTSLLKKSASKEKSLSPEELAEQKARLKAEQEEYERQMEEYNRQLEEYNRQVAEQEALEAKEAAERAEQERIEAEKAAAEKAEQERIAAEKAAAEKAEADRIAAEKAEAERAEQERLAAIEKVAADAARAAAAAEKAAALAAAKLAAAETALAAEAAAEAAAAAIAAAEAAGVKPSAPAPAKEAPKPSVSKATIQAAASQSPLKPAGKPALKAAVAHPSPTQALREKSVKATGDADTAPSTSLLRTAVASAAAKSEAKPPATRLLAAAGNSVPKKGLKPALGAAKASPKPTTKLASAAASGTKLTKAASTTKLASAAPSGTKLTKAAATPSKLGGLKKATPATALKAAPKAAVPAPNAEPVPTEEELVEGAEAPAVEPTEEELHARDAYLNALQAGADATPLWKSPMFLIACVVLLLGGGGAAYYVSSVNATKAAYAKNVEETNRLLRQAGEINKAGAETLADVNKKNIKLECSLADAERLMSVIVDPFQKDENGVNRYGGAPEGVAQNAGLLLGIMAEKEPAIEAMIFKSLEQNASKIKPALFSWMIQRLGVAEVKNINNKFKTLTEKIAAQPKFKTKPKQLSAIWEVMGLRISAKDLPVILDILKNEEIDAELVATLSTCLDNIIEMTDDPAQKAKMGDQIFDSVPEKYRKKLIMTLASACSEKALKYYKKRLENQNNWPTEMNFVAFWGNDDLVDFAIEKHEASKEDTRMNPYALGAVSGIFRQVRDRDQATVDKLMAVLYDKLDEDSSQWQEIINKTDPDAGDFIGKDHADYPGLMEKRADLEASRRQKIGLAKSLGEMRSYTWIDDILAKLAKDSDEDVVRAAEDAQEKIKSNTAKYAARKAKYERRSKK